MEQKIKMKVSVTFPEHDEVIDGETVHFDTSRHQFSYEWKSKYYREETKENRKFIKETIKKDKEDDIAMKIKQIISMYQQATGAQQTKHIVGYGVDFNA